MRDSHKKHSAVGWLHGGVAVGADIPVLRMAAYMMAMILFPLALVLAWQCCLRAKDSKETVTEAPRAESTSRTKASSSKYCPPRMSWCDLLAVISFNVILVITGIPLWTLAKVGLCFVTCIPQLKTCLASFTRRGIQLWWWIALTMSCWVRIRHEGIEEYWRSLKSPNGKPICIIMNHTSFLDCMLVVVSIPFREMAWSSSIFSNHLFEMPFIGGLSLASDQIRVDFKSQRADDFSADKDQVLEMKAKVRQCLAAGNSLVWCPEGTINGNDPTQVQRFRAAGFEAPVEIDCEIWCVAMVGNPACWPKAGVGGRPSRITMRFFRLCESSKEFMNTMSADPESKDPKRDACIFMANAAREQMQSEVDAICLEGWATSCKPVADSLSRDGEHPSDLDPVAAEVVTGPCTAQPH